MFKLPIEELVLLADSIGSDSSPLLCSVFLGKIVLAQSLAENKLPLRSH